MAKPVSYKARNTVEILAADIQSLHDHSYATDDHSLQDEIKYIKETCIEILNNQAIIMKDIELIKQESKFNDSHHAMENTEVSANKQNESPINKIRIKLPCSSVEEMEDLEQKIQEDEQFESYICQHFERIHEYQLPKFVKTAFQSIMTDDVSRCYTWFGLNNNRCIKDFKLISILLEIANQKFPQAPKEITVNFMKKYFVTCKDKNRKKKLKMEEAANAESSL